MNKFLDNPEQPLPQILFRPHAVLRMRQQRITRGEVIEALKSAEVIEENPADVPFPSCLVLGWAGSMPLHIVLAHIQPTEPAAVVTVYRPDEENWDDEYRQRLNQ